MTTLLLDLDGTLSDNFTGIGNCIRHALRKLGAPEPGEALLRPCVGPPLRESFARLLGRDDPGTIEAAIAAYRERYGEHGWRENEPYPGIAEALASLAAAGARLFVCTSKAEVFATRIIGHFGFDAYITRVYGSDLAGTLDDKRDLLARLIAVERLDPARCIMVGDRVHDVRAAQANGTRAVGVLWGFGDADELRGAERLLRTPSELPSLAATAPA